MLHCSVNEACIHNSYHNTKHIFTVHWPHNVFVFKTQGKESMIELLCINESCYIVHWIIKYISTTATIIPNTFITNISIRLITSPFFLELYWLHWTCPGVWWWLLNTTKNWSENWKGNTIHNVYYFIFGTNIDGILFFNFSDEKTFMKR